MSRTRIAAWAGLWLAAAAPAQEPYRIEFQSRTFVPSGGVSPALARRVEARRGSNGRVHLVVQLNEIPSRGTREALGLRGLVLQDPLPGNAYHASLDPGSPLAAEVASGNSAALAASGVRSAAPHEPGDKLAAELGLGEIPAWAEAEIAGRAAVDVHILYYKDVAPADARQETETLGARVLSTADYFERLTARVPLDRLSEFAAADWVLAITPVPPPAAADNNVTSADLMSVPAVQSAPFGLSGAGVRIGIFDTGIDRHPDFRSRLTIVENQAVAEHGTHVTGTVAGSGESNPALKGMAPSAEIFSWSFAGDTPAKNVNGVREHGIQISQNSWGFVVDEAQLNNCNAYGAYTTTERDMDRVVANERLAIVFSAGNNRSNPDCAITARGGFYNGGRPAAAKNVISVAAISSERAMSTFSNFGPNKDGRLKPDISAMGVSLRSTALNGGSSVLSGTSMAAPGVTGVLALLIERYRQRLADRPAPALLKAILLNTATDLGNPGPDYSFGYGLPNTTEAVATIDEQRFTTGSIANGARTTASINVPAGAPALRVMVAWSDREGTPNTLRALVNDLDLELTAPDGTTRHLPLTLDPSSPAGDARPATNSRDNVEQVVIDRPAAGAWTAVVRGTAVAGGDQEYALAWTTAAVAAPGCTTTVTPSAVTIAETEAAIPFAVYRGSTCEPWSARSSAEWLAAPDTTTRASGVVKVRVQENPGGPRVGTANVAGATVQIIQNSRCRVSPVQSGERIESELGGEDCFRNAQMHSRVFTFLATQGQTVSIAMNSGAFDSFLQLLSPAGAQLATNDNGGGGLNARIPATSGQLTLNASGPYTVVARSGVNRQTGPFDLTMTLREPGVFGGGEGRAPVMLSGCPAAMSGQLNAESSRLGRCGDQFFTDVCVFSGRVGEAVAIDVTEADFDTVLYLIAPNGAQFAFNDDAGTASLSGLATPLNVNGQWRIEVSSFSPGVRGNYTLNVTGCAAPE